MPLFFLQKQALGASGSAYRGPARAIRARGSSTGEFHGGVPRGSSGGSQTGNTTTESRIPLLIRCRLHIREYSTQLLIVVVERNYPLDTLSSA
jgi:hypothetical protein